MAHMEGKDMADTAQYAESLAQYKATTIHREDYIGGRHDFTAVCLAAGVAVTPQRLDNMRKHAEQVFRRAKPAPPHHIRYTANADGSICMTPERLVGRLSDYSRRELDEI